MMRQCLRVAVLIGLAVGAAVGAAPTFAQGGGDGDLDDVCPAIVEAALGAVDAVCAETGRDEACYGYTLVAAAARPDVEAFTFEQSGDIVPVADLAGLQLAGMDAAAEAWGVALMRIRADLPEALPGQNVTMLLFGDVALTNDGQTLTTADVTATVGVNLRAWPSTEAPVLASFAAGETVPADAILPDGSWLRITTPDGISGWVFAELMTGDVDALTVLAAGAGEPVFGPMQAFTFQSGFGDAPCAQAPESGMLIQTPDGAREVTLRVNDVTLQVGSTVWVQTAPLDDGDLGLLIGTLEGEVTALAAGVMQVIPAGGVAAVPLSETLHAIGAPLLHPLDFPWLDALPLDQLAEAITPAQPITPEAAAAYAAEVVDGAAVAAAALYGIDPDDPCAIAAAANVYTHTGPGFGYPVAGVVLTGGMAYPGALTQDGDVVWYEVQPGAWMQAGAVQAAGACEDLPAPAFIPPLPDVLPDGFDPDDLPDDLPDGLDPDDLPDDLPDGLDPDDLPDDLPDDFDPDDLPDDFDDLPDPLDPPDLPDLPDFP